MKSVLAIVGHTAEVSHGLMSWHFSMNYAWLVKCEFFVFYF